ncbi:MAG: ubiquinone anaerobic biosynthesis accessory factor UbiT [Solirubrobacterales bacterium]
MTVRRMLAIDRGVMKVMTEGQSRPGPAPMTPPFTPVLLLGMALQPVRPSLLQPAFDAMLRVIRKRHPDILERMEPYADAVVCIAPVDLPFVILFEPHPADPRLVVRRQVDPGEITATIRGPLEMLIALAEGKVDGDALFFSRQLVIEGDTEVVVALRNAIDGAGIDLIEDLTSALGPFARPARRCAGAALSLVSAVRANVETLRQALIAPVVRDRDAQAARLTELESEVRQLRKAARRGRA